MPATRRKVKAVTKETVAPEPVPVVDAADQQVSDVDGEEVAPPKKKSKKDDKPKYDSLWDVVIEGEEEDQVPVYDDCNEIRRKIRALQKEPGHKITHWLKAIGNVNSNSLTQFMKQTGANGGAGNQAYYKGYIYFEKRRIFEGKKKSTKRISNEAAHPNGFKLQTRTYVWMPA
ncbi:hypothetical protein FRC03_008619 [Tulasnella sp. 419]|nr:hypothetical protein FRC02_009980 [Tulasnella sp. 418]KAG8970422.1 hypothetical protein FRC03_008619 [Tulasnella sp. 419]